MKPTLAVTFTHLCRVDYSTSTIWTGPFLTEEMYDMVLLLPCFIQTIVFNANSADPDQTPQNAATDLGLPCLLMSLLWDARLKWVKERLLES